MEQVQKIITQSALPFKVEGKVRTLFTEGELVMPIGLLLVSKEYRCTLNDIMKFCSLIENYTYLPPILVSDKNLIIDGNKRYYAYLRLGYQKVGVIRQQNIGDGFGDNEFSILNIHS